MTASGSSAESVVFGHEFSGRVAEYGSKCRKDLPADTPVVALPLLRGAQGVDLTGLTPHAPGAYAEQLLVQESMMMAVPNGLDPAVAALTEPMAVALHAVRRGEVGKRDVAIVIGCGPVGLGVILMLKASGVRTVVAERLLGRPQGARRPLRGGHRRRSLAGVPLRAAGGPRLAGEPSGRARARPRHARETRAPAGRRLVAPLAPGGKARPGPEAARGLRVRRGSRV